MPQIEKRFNFSSFEIGMIAAANDVAAVALGLIVSHYGSFGNKVRWIGLGGVLTCEYYVNKSSGTTLIDFDCSFGYARNNLESEANC